MRVLHLNAGNLYGGVETFLSTLGRHRDLCNEMKPEFVLCWEGRLSRELQASGARVHLLDHVRLRDPFSVRRARSKLSRLLSATDFGAVICHMPWSHTVFGPVVRQAGLPLIFWMHGATTGKHWLERLAGRIPPDTVICPSKYVASTASNIFPNTRTFVSYYPVTPGLKQYSTDEIAEIKSELDTASDAIVIIQASRLEEGKGQKIHLEALGKMREVTGWVCWQVGGPQRPRELDFFRELKQTAERLGIAARVKFLGQRSDVPRLLAASDIYCQPNTAPEGLPVTFAEALHAGLPIVTSEICGFWELVDKSCGLLLPPGNLDALAKALAHLIQDSSYRQRLGRAAPAQANRISNPGVQIRNLYSILAQTTSASCGSYRSASNN
jgi:glycosyltransferase involved in cell wall biosynthesis